MVAALLAAAALVAPTPNACPATSVQYVRAKHPVYWDTPWVLARPHGPAIAGFLVTYSPSLRDGRVNRSGGVVLWTAGSQIVWTVSGSGRARRLDGRRSFSFEVKADAVSELRFPSAGCWRLTIHASRGTASIVARVVRARATDRCDATPIERAGVFARPRSSGIRGGWGPWRTADGGALLYTHGRHVAGGMNMKVLWRVAGDASRATDSLELVGARLDGAGSFRQEFVYAPGLYPSIVDVPTSGCWLLRLRTGRHAGAIVVRAIDG
jgi:hypothetical protein